MLTLTSTVSNLTLIYIVCRAQYLPQRPAWDDKLDQQPGHTRGQQLGNAPLHGPSACGRRRAPVWAVSSCQRPAGPCCQSVSTAHVRWRTSR